MLHSKKKNIFIFIYGVLVVVFFLSVFLSLTFSSSHVFGENIGFGENIVYGDVNGDNSVNPLDAAILARSLAGWSGYEVLINDTAADADNNGSINPMDLNCLTKYLGQWVGFENLPYITVTAEPTVTATLTSEPTATPMPTSEPTADTSSRIMVSSTSGSVGDQVEIKINLVNNPGISVMRLKLDYASNLKLISVQDSNYLGSYAHGTDLNINPYQLYWTGADTSSNNTYNGTIATLVFEILYGDSGNDYGITLSYNIDNYDVYDIDLTPVLFNITAGTVTLTGLSVTKMPTATPTPTPTAPPIPSYVSPYTYKEYDKSVYCFDRDRILIGGWDFNKAVSTDKGMQDFVDFGGDFLIHATSKLVLPFAEKYNIGILAYKVNTERDTFSSASSLADVATIASFDTLAERYSTYHCVWGDDIFDEPHSLFFDYFDQIVDIYREKVPTKMPFFNLNPLQHGADSNDPYAFGESYQEYIDSYANTVDTDYICFDLYPFDNEFCGFMSNYFVNMDIVSTACRESGRDFWIITQAGAVNGYGIVTTDKQVSFQAYTSLAYGADAIIYACYTPSWWGPETSIVNALGVKNPLWETTKKLNSEIHAISDIYMDYVNEGVVAVKSNFNNYNNQAYKNIMNQLDVQNARSARRDYTSVDGFTNFNFGDVQYKAILAGGFGEKNGEGNAVMLVNQSDPYAPVPTTVYFEITNQGNTVTAYIQGVPTVLTSVDGVYSVTIPAGEGVFVVSD